MELQNDDEIQEANRFSLPASRWVGSKRHNLKAFMTENQTGVVVGMTFQRWSYCTGFRFVALPSSGINWRHATL